MDTSRANESFRSLLLRHRGRTGLTQRDLAARAGVSERSVQDWEAGVKFPSAERLQALIRALLQAGALTSGHEILEARDLWAAAEREAPRMHTPFDEEWFAALLAARATPSPEPPRDGPHTARVAQPGTGTAERAQDWGEAPDTIGFVGRAEELELLRTCVLEERCRLMAVLGFGGIGKTSLAARLARDVAPSFERVYWRSLRNAPPVSEWLAGAIGFLSDQQLVPPASESERIAALLQLLRTRRCLLVLDNSETLFEPGQREGRYRAGMEGYGRVLQALGEASHQSCLVLTSREAPPELALLGAGVSAFELSGFSVHEAQALLVDKQLHGDEQAWASLVGLYGGNGLALRIVAETIRQVYDGDIAGFLQDAIDTHGTVFGGIRHLLDAQVERLSPLERDILMRLAVEREPISQAELATDMAPSMRRSMLVEAIETLRSRSLVEHGERSATFTLQSLVLEYMTNRLVETAAHEIERSQPLLLAELPLIKAQARDYVRQTQERLIGTPVLQQLKARYAVEGSESRLLALLEGWRDRPAAEQGYGPGNIVNLLRLLRGHLRGLDLSRLALRQVYLQGVDAQDASLAGTRLVAAILDEAFAYTTAIALSADGSLLLAGTSTGEVRLWRVADRTPLLAVQGHTGAVWNVAFSADARTAASASFDGTVKVWEVESGLLLATLKGHAGAVRGVALSGDGRLVASSGYDGTVRLWEVAGGRLLDTLQGHTGPVLSVALSSDAKLVASGSSDGVVQLWEAWSGNHLATLQGHTGVVRSVALSGEGGLLASGGDDGTVQLWEVASGQQLFTLRAHAGAVLSVALSREGRFVASGGDDRTVRLWDRSSGQLVATLQRHTGGVLAVALSADGRLLASGSGDATIQLSEAPSGHLLATLQGHTGAVRGVALSRDQRVLANSSVDGTVRLWDGLSGQLVAGLQGHTGAVRGVALSADGWLVASGGVDGTVRLWEVPGRRLLATLQGHTGAVWGVALSADGRLVTSSGVDETVRLWEVPSGRLLTILQGHRGAVMAVALSRDAGLLASGGVDGTVRVWETASRQLMGTLQRHTGVVLSVVLSGDGRLVVSGGTDRMVRVWDAVSGRLLATLEGHTGAVWCVAASGSGGLVASGGDDGTVRLWESATGQLLATLQGHTGLVWGLALSEDGRLVASGGTDGMVKMWDAGSGVCLRTLRGDRRYERLDITGVSGVTDAQRAALFALGAIEHAPTSNSTLATTGS